MEDICIIYIYIYIYIYIIYISIYIYYLCFVNATCRCVPCEQTRPLNRYRTFNTISLQLACLRKKVLGAIAHCEKKKLYKKCPYENVRKYLVLTSDKVEYLSCIRDPCVSFMH